MGNSQWGSRSRAPEEAIDELGDLKNFLDNSLLEVRAHGVSNGNSFPLSGESSTTFQASIEPVISMPRGGPSVNTPHVNVLRANLVREGSEIELTQLNTFDMTTINESEQREYERHLKSSNGSVREYPINALMSRPADHSWSSKCTLVVSSTISKDHTKGESARNAELLATLAQRYRKGPFRGGFGKQDSKLQNGPSGSVSDDGTGVHLPTDIEIRTSSDDNEWGTVYSYEIKPSDSESRPPTRRGAANGGNLGGINHIDR
jgi:hypothetical protein